jgi:hypothetical protein
MIQIYPCVFPNSSSNLSNCDCFEVCKETIGCERTHLVRKSFGFPSGNLQGKKRGAVRPASELNFKLVFG